MTTTIPVHLPSQSYYVVIAAAGLANLGQSLQQTAALKPGSKILLVSNPVVFKHYGQTILDSLLAQGFQVTTCLLPAGERYKTLNSVQKIYDQALAQRLERSSTIIALGGGVIGDMAGFAAATWLRGINVVQVPTTLLAMVDASMGGKTGVNHPQGKNLIGAFHQPRLVLIDPNTLKTLPRREFRSALAEVIKYGVIWDSALFEQLEAAKRIDQYNLLPTELLAEILNRSCQAKVDVVSKDEREAGLRAILNYGHTIGHGVESQTHYRLFTHGEAVGLGMVAVGEIACELGLWSQDCRDRQLALIQKAGLPTRLPPDLDLDALLESLKIDKKVKAGQVQFIMPTSIGTVTITDQVPREAILKALKQMQAT
jgi:3-dehydroquinate synthase